MLAKVSRSSAREPSAPSGREPKTVTAIGAAVAHARLRMRERNGRAELLRISCVLMGIARAVVVRYHCGGPLRWILGEEV